MSKRIGTLLFSAAVLVGQAGSVWAAEPSERVHDLPGTALRPKIGSAKAQGAGRSHSAVKLGNAGWRDFGPQPEGPAAIFPQYGVAARYCSSATPRSLRLVSQKNSRRRGVAEIMNTLSVTEIRQELAAATPEQPADFSGDDLSHLDLSGLDLAGTNLAGADLSHARLENTNLQGANLMHAVLDGAWLIGADFSNANLSHAHMFGPVVANGLQTSRAASPIFRNAQFDNARVIARLSNGDDAGADFSNAKLAADMGNQSMGLMRFEAEGANLQGADFSGAELGHALFRFANLKNADFSGADIQAAEFDGADLTGARFTGAKAKDASFADADLAGATGMDEAHDMDVSEARNTN